MGKGKDKGKGKVNDKGGGGGGKIYQKSRLTKEGLYVGQFLTKSSKIP